MMNTLEDVVKCVGAHPAATIGCALNAFAVLFAIVSIESSSSRYIPFSAYSP